MLRFAVQRYSTMVTPFEWTRQEDGWEFPLWAEADGIVATIETMRLQRLTEAELAKHDWEPDTIERGRREHLVVNVVATALVVSDPPGGASLDLEVVTAEGDVLRPEYGTSTGWFESKGVKGFDTRTYETSCHLFDVTQVPALSKITLTVRRDVPFDEAWVPLPTD